MCAVCSGRWSRRAVSAGLRGGRAIRCRRLAVLLLSGLAVVALLSAAGRGVLAMGRWWLLVPAVTALGRRRLLVAVLPTGRGVLSGGWVLPAVLSLLLRRRIRRLAALRSRIVPRGLLGRRVLSVALRRFCEGSRRC